MLITQIKNRSIMTNAVNPKRLFFLIFLFVIISVLLPSHVTQAKTIKEREDELHQEKVLMAQKVAKREQQDRAKKAAEKQVAEEKRLAAKIAEQKAIQQAVVKATKQAEKAAEQKRDVDAEKSTVQKNNVIEPEMIAIKGGCFLMGSPDTEKERGDNEKQHQVCVEDFKIGKYEVTQAQWQAVMGKNPSKFKGDDLPVESVSYNDVQDFINKLNGQTGQRYRLPTEAEWEYAARAGTRTAFYTGDCINTNQANYYGNYDYNNCGAKIGVYKKTMVAVASYPANPWGLYNMAGNVLEWTCSVYDKDYGDSEKQCSSNNNANIRHVIRGGSWINIPNDLRSAFRNHNTPNYSIGILGFRLSKM